MFGKKKKVENSVENRTVLFVDDDEAILNSLERGLIDELYNTLFTTSCKEALEILQREDVHVIVTDMRMPEMSGLEFIKIIKKEYPHVINIVLSGYGDETALRNAVEQGEIFKLIPKPWKLRGNFEKVILRALEHYNLQNECETVRQKN
ncbi:MAG: response regulator [Planctomycetota bacterium]|jgi:DNA-binding NtrC family response regulator